MTTLHIIILYVAVLGALAVAAMCWLATVGAYMQINELKIKVVAQQEALDKLDADISGAKDKIAEAITTVEQALRLIEDSFKSHRDAPSRVRTLLSPEPPGKH